MPCTTLRNFGHQTAEYRAVHRRRVAPTALYCGGRTLASAGTNVENWRQPLPGCGGKPPIVALGKFDALHKGHRALAIQAAEMGGSPWLLSFSGMAEVLGWPKRPPLVAECDRLQVLKSWGPLCQGRAPLERLLPFAAVRSMSPADFVALLADQLQVAGVVVGRGYRFGYKQAGDTDLLQKLGKEAGLQVCVAELVGAATAGVVGKVSSSEVRNALAQGRMARVRDYLGRPYRLIATLPALQLQEMVRIPFGSFLNQLPAQRSYTADVEITCDPGKRIALTGSTVTLDERDVTVRHENLQLCLSNVSEATVAISFSA